MSRPLAVVLMLVALAACGDPIDGLLEQKVTPDVHLQLTLQSSAVTVTQGSTGSVTASITRIGDYHGDVAFTLTGLPDGVTGEVGTPVTSGQVTTATITFNAGVGAPLGVHGVTVHGTGGKNGAAFASVAMEIVPLPTIALSLSSSSLTIVQGGIAPLGVVIARVRAPDPVTLALVGKDGITALVATNPIAESSADVTIAVASGVAPGSYAMTLRASSPGVDDRLVPLTIVVSADPLQLIAQNAIASQASIVSSDVIVNRNGVTGAVSFAADGLPAGVTASFQGGAASATSAKVIFTVSGSTPAGSAVVTLRGQADGAAPASTTLILEIGASNVGFTLVPPAVTIQQGSSTASLLTLIRSSFTGPVTIQAIGVPAGLTVTAADPIVMGNSTVITVSSDASIVPGLYPILVRAIPAPVGGAGGPALDPVTATLNVTVLDAHQGGDSNVLLDWSACTQPEWVAAQDGAGAWTQLAGAGGIFHFAVNSGRGGFAYVIGGALSVRFGLASELAAAPIALCSIPVPTKSVTGTADHTQATIGVESFTWGLGGGIAVSTKAAPNFTITGVPEGTFDLIGSGLVRTDWRFFIQRDLNIPAGGSVGTVSLTDAGSFKGLPVSLTVQGLINESSTQRVGYLSGPACTANVLRETAFLAGSGGFTTTIYGIPEEIQRPDDYHQLDVSAISGNRTRTVSASFHAMGGRTALLPPSITPTVQTIAGGQKRLRVIFDQGLPANYNGSLRLSYADQGHSVTVQASVASLGIGTTILDTPDFSDMSGFPAAAAMPAAASVNWNVAAAGSNGQPLCGESMRWSSTWKGTQ